MHFVNFLSKSFHFCGIVLALHKKMLPLATFSVLDKKYNLSSHKVLLVKENFSDMHKFQGLVKTINGRISLHDDFEDQKFI